MTQIDKEVERQKSKMHKKKVAMEWKIHPRVEVFEEGSSYSSMSMYNLDSDGEDLDGPSIQSPTIVLYDDPPPMHMEEVHSSTITKKEI